MIIYKFVIGIYIDEKDTEKLRVFCEKNNLEFEDDLNEFHNDPVWQDIYRKETGFSGKIKRCYISLKTNNKEGVKEVFNALEQADFDAMINIELS